MKKIISILLTVVMIFSFVSVGITAYAKDKNVAKENTYIASQSTYLNGYGQVYAKGEYKTPDESNPNLYVFVVSLVYIDADGKEVVIKEIQGDTPVLDMYIRGKTVYYSVSGSTNVESGIYSIKSDGTGEKCLLKEGSSLIGGYGEAPVIKQDKVLYKVVNGEKIKLQTLNSSKSGITLFNGKIYFDNKAYNLDTNKTSKFTIKSAVSTKKYMYYTSGVDNLVMLDKSNQKTYLSKKVYDVHGGNNNKNVVFSKKDSKGQITFYRSSSTNKIYKLATYKNIYKAIKQNEDFEKMGKGSVSARFVNGKVVFLIKGYESALLQVKNTGSTVKFIEQTGILIGSTNLHNRPEIDAYGTSIYFVYKDSEGEAIFYQQQQIK